MKFDIVGVGNALVDETYYVSRDFVDSTGLPFNHFHPITHEQQETIISSATLINDFKHSSIYLSSLNVIITADILIIIIRFF